jgi:hypothetical protein
LGNSLVTILFMHRDALEILCVVIMDREKAAAVLKEILNTCEGVTSYLAIMPQNTNKVLSRGHQIHIKTNPNTLDHACIQNIAIKNKLAITQKNDVLVIYKPVK